ncbi:MAG: energy transducer TonB [Bdellovibrionaceae bacterium]|nr:energy transducer TonB [Pseudobdellovibrionaceae bacterium]
MKRFKFFLTKKILLIDSAIKQIKNKWLIFFYAIRHFISKNITNLLEYINKIPILNKTFLSLKYFLLKIIYKFFDILDKIPIINKITPVLNKKYIGLSTIALLVSLFIFYFMSILISTGKQPIQKENQNINISFLLDPKIESLELRDRRLPKKPKQEDPPPETPKIKIQQRELQKPEMISQLPQLDLPTDFQSDEKGTGVSSQINKDREVTPIFRIQPIYPRRAALQNIEGFVILQFDITSSGFTDNITVLQSSPPQIFNSSAIQALKKWKYKPKLENGKPVRQTNLKVQLDFRLRDQ